MKLAINSVITLKFATNCDNNDNRDNTDFFRFRKVYYEEDGNIYNISKCHFNTYSSEQ